MRTPRRDTFAKTASTYSRSSGEDARFAAAIAGGLCGPRADGGGRGGGGASSRWIFFFLRFDFCVN
jgi:hypothetical protein